MARINFTVEDHSIRVDNLVELTQGSNNFDVCNFEFDSSWDGYTKYGIFYQNPSEAIKVPLSDNSCNIPAEVLRTAGKLYVGARGVLDGNHVATTQVVSFRIRNGAVDGSTGATEEITASEYEIVMAAVTKANARIDNLIAHNDDTEGNSELIDIRVDANGNVHESAGEAVRAQVSQLSEEIANLSGGAPTPVSVVADMTDTAKIYLYTGAEDGYIAGNWYYYDGTAWVSGGKYGETNTTEATSIEPENDDIPKVFFDEDIPQTKDDVITKFRYISKTQDISGYAKFKAQGNTSMTFPKKNMTVKMYQDEACETKLKVNYKGWGKQSKHVYKANWIDLTHARNIVSARLWADIVMARSDYGTLPGLLKTSPNQGVVDGFPVKVYSKGVYQGRYTLNIPKDAWMLNMDDSLEINCILCSENYVSGCFRATANIDGSDWTDEVHDTVPDIIKTRWNEIITFVINSSDDEFKKNLSNYFDVQSLTDYLIFGVVSCGLDGFGKNQIYYTYDNEIYFAQMYDMDATWGLWWNGSTFVSSDYARENFQDFADGEGNLLYIRLAKLFYEEIQARYEELKNGVLSIPNIINKFERFTDIAPLDLVKEDYASTTGSGKFTGIPSQITNNIQQIRQYVVDRYIYCDEYFSSLTPKEEIPCTGITIDLTSLSLTDETTQALTAILIPSDTTDTVIWSSSDNSIATVSKGVVTPVSNGDCVITATCGTQSATCNVSVTAFDLSKQTIPLTNVGLWKETGLDSSVTRWKTSDIMPLPTGFEYDTITVKGTTEQTIVDVFDSEQNFVYEYAGTPASALLQDVQYYAVAKSDSSATELEIQFTQTYPNAIKIPTPNTGLWKSAGLDSSATSWRSSDIVALPTDMTSGMIEFADGISSGRIITTFDVDKNFIAENANISSITFGSNVKYYAVAINSSQIFNRQTTNLALYVNID
ncbi:MAG: CotH kinase family protein [Lachnospiraceae bacterium]|nr:CotH kinase family protein [Lachnospiraceae bacterium]